MPTTKGTKDTKNGEYHDPGSSFVSFVPFVVREYTLFPCTDTTCSLAG